MGAFVYMVVEFGRDEALFIFIYVMIGNDLAYTTVVSYSVQYIASTKNRASLGQPTDPEPNNISADTMPLGGRN